MKKIILPILTLLLFCGSILTVSAAGPETPESAAGAGTPEPVINNQFPDCSVPTDTELILFSDASSPDGGTLEYL